MEKRRMCPNCRAFVSDADRVCPYCEAQLMPSRPDRPVRRVKLDSGLGMIPAAHFTTVVILLINAGLYVATALFSLRHSEGGGFWDIDGRTLAVFGAKWGPAIAAGQWWRLITAGFLHGGIMHIVMNSWVIFDLGAAVEEFYGTARYLVIYVAATIAGFLASTFWSPAVSVGASAGLFGLIGAMIALGMRSRGPLGADIKAHFTQWAIWALAIGFLPFFQTDNAAHIGGLAAGFGVGFVAGTPNLIPTWTERLWQGAALGAVALTIAAFAMMLLGFRSLVE